MYHQNHYKSMKPSRGTNPLIHFRALGHRFHYAYKIKIDFWLQSSSVSLTKDKFKQRWLFFLTKRLRVLFSPWILQICWVLQRRIAMLLIFFREQDFLGNGIFRGTAREFLICCKIAFVKIWECGSKTRKVGVSRNISWQYSKEKNYPVTLHVSCWHSL